MSEDRFARNELLFGKEGQARLRQTTVAVMGAGGLGSPVIAQTALLGAGGINTVDRGDLKQSNRNRYVGAWHTDPVPGTPKVGLAKRHVGLIDPSVRVVAVKDDIVSPAGLEVIKAADYVFGCVDNDGARFFLNEACLAYGRPQIDLASDLPEPGAFGGRVMIVAGENGCLHCQDLLDPEDVRRFFSSSELLENEAAVYGVEKSALGETGPSVASVNGVIASLGVSAFMMMVTGMALPFSYQTYRGDLGTVTRRKTERADDCYYCTVVRGTGDQAGLERYFRKSAA